MAGAFWGTWVLEIVKRNDSPGLLWKRIKLTTTRKANAKKRLRRVWQEVFHGYGYTLSQLEEERLRIINGKDLPQLSNFWHFKIYNEAVLRACAEPPSAKGSSVSSARNGEEGGSN